MLSAATPVQSSFVAALVAVAAVTSEAPAQARVTGYAPNPACRGGEVRVSGMGLDIVRPPSATLKYGQGGTPRGDLSVAPERWGSTSITTTLPDAPDLAPGTYWIAVYDGSGRLASNRLESLRILICVPGDPGPGEPDEPDPDRVDIRPAPSGAVAPVPVRVTPELELVSVERTGSGAIHGGDRIPVNVLVRNTSRYAADVAVGWVGDKPFRVAGYHTRVERVPPSGQVTFSLELRAIPQLTRGNRFTTNVALLDPRTLSLYTGDGNKRDNSKEVSFEIGLPEAYDLTATWTSLQVFDDSDPGGSGEWELRLLACVVPEGNDDPFVGAGGCTPVEAVWPRGVSGAGGKVTMDVADGLEERVRRRSDTYTIGPSVTLNNVPGNQKVAVFTRVRDDDGLEGWERLQGHRIIFDPSTWRGWNRPVSMNLNRGTLLYWSDNNRSALEYTGTMQILATSSR